MHQKPEIEFKNAGKKPPFTLPDNYFDQFPERMIKRLESDSVIKPERASTTWQFIKPQLSLAAAITAFALVGYLLLYNFIGNPVNELSNSAIADYIDYYYYDFNEAEIVNFIAENDQLLDYESFINSDFFDLDAYLDYLYNEEINIELIYTGY